MNDQAKPNTTPPSDSPKESDLRAWLDRLSGPQLKEIALQIVRRDTVHRLEPDDLADIIIEARTTNDEMSSKADAANKRAFAKEPREPRKNPKDKAGNGVGTELSES